MLLELLGGELPWRAGKDRTLAAGLLPLLTLRLARRACLRTGPWTGALPPTPASHPTPCFPSHPLLPIPPPATPNPPNPNPHLTPLTAPTLARHVTKDRDAVLEMKRAHEADMLRASGATRSNHGVPVSTWAAEVGTAPPHMAVMYGAAAHEARLRLCF